MNKEQARAWAPLIQAIAEGKTLQMFVSSGEAQSDYWGTFQEGMTLLLDYPGRYRIKPESKKQSCRMYLVKSTNAKTGDPFYTAIASNSNVREIESVESSAIFVRWLTDVIEYEILE